MKKIISLAVCFLMLLSAASCKPSDVKTIGKSGESASSGSSSKNKSSSSTKSQLNSSGTSTQSQAGTNSTTGGASSSKASSSSKVASSSKANSSQSGVATGMTKDQVIAKIANANITKEMYERSVVYEGNKARLKALFEKAKRGENITVAALGGSITEGAGTSYAYSQQVMDWFSSTYSGTVTKKKAGVGGTPSTLGVFRMEKDILAYNPDFVIIDFSVNDSSSADYKEAYEGIIRKLLKAPKQPAIICIGFARRDSNNTQDIHVEVAQRYGIPFISYQDAVKPEIAAERLLWTKISNDTVHPNDTGAKIAADLVKYFLIYNSSNLSQITDTALTTPTPLTPNKYENAKFYNNTDLNATLSGFSKISDAYNSVEGLKNGWKTTTVGSTIEFTLNAKSVRLCYIKSKSTSGGGIIEKFKNGTSLGTFDSKNSIDYDMVGFTTIYDGVPEEYTYKLSLKSGERFTLIGVMVLE